jgi:hypothetical protein
MQRTVRATAVFGCFLVLLISTVAVAQEKPQIAVPATKESPDWKCGPSPWTMEAGVCVALIPRLLESHPEFAILGLTPKQHHDFEEDPVGFLNHHKVFANKVQKANISFLKTKIKMKMDSLTPARYVMVGHWPSSNSTGKEIPASDPMGKDPMEDK